jgi:hypothetical protein
MRTDPRPHTSLTLGAAVGTVGAGRRRTASRIYLRHESARFYRPPSSANTSIDNQPAVAPRSPDNRVMPGFSLRIFLVDGKPDGLRIVTKSHWTGVVAVATRSQVTEVLERDEFKATGVYILHGVDDDSGSDKVYVGEGDNIAIRILRHYKEKGWWQQVVAVSAVGQTLDKADVRFLEAELVMRARVNGLVVVDNEQSPKPPSPQEADAADLNSFLFDILDILPVLGIRSFEVPNTKHAGPIDPLGTSEAADGASELTLNVTGISASGFVATGGFVVRAGSMALPPKPSITSGGKGLRQTLEASGKLVPLAGHEGHLSVASDIKFRSPSQAASVLYGTNLNGRDYWKDSLGRSLNELESISADEEMDSITADVNPEEGENSDSGDQAASPTID